MNDETMLAEQPEQPNDNGSFTPYWYQVPTLPAPLSHIVQHILDDLQQDVHTERLAQQFDISENKLQDLFQQYLSLSPDEYQEKVRLNKAQHLLEKTLWSLEEIAGESGFGNIATMQDIFLQKLDMFPSRYK